MLSIATPDSKYRTTPSRGRGEKPFIDVAVSVVCDALVAHGYLPGVCPGLWVLRLLPTHYPVFAVCQQVFIMSRLVED